MTAHGAVGNLQVKGVRIQLPAEALSVEPGGAVEKLGVGGSVITCGAKVTMYAVEGGKALANGERPDAVPPVAGKGSMPLTRMHTCARAGSILRETDGESTDRTGFLIPAEHHRVGPPDHLFN